MKSLLTFVRPMLCCGPSLLGTKTALTGVRAFASTSSMSTIYDVGEITSIDGSPVSMDKYRGKVVLVSNLASV